MSGLSDEAARWRLVSDSPTLPLQLRAPIRSTPTSVSGDPEEATKTGRAVGAMAIGTAISRLTGLLRVIMTFSALGFGSLADAYNLANTVPNIVVDLVLGGVVSATFIPVFVEQLARRSRDDAWRAISSVISVTVLVVLLASACFALASPAIVRGLTLLNTKPTAGETRQLATDLLWLFVPQLAGYALVALSTALLNANRRFAAPMFVPIANNLVVIAVLGGFIATAPSTTSPSGRLPIVLQHPELILLLGLGTTLGVIIQALLLIPSLRRAGIQLTWSPRFDHPAVRQVLRLSGWTLGLVAGNQIALMVVISLAQPITGGVSAYTYAYTFFQLPYGVVAVSIMTAVAPAMAEAWSRRDRDRFRRHLGNGLGSMLGVIAPAAALLLVLAEPLIGMLGSLRHGGGDTHLTGVTLSILALGLPGFCVFLYAIRALQSMQDLRAAFWCYVVENGCNVGLAVVLVGPLGMGGIALSISVAYSLAAVLALALVRSRARGLGWHHARGPLVRLIWASPIVAVAGLIGSHLTGGEGFLALGMRVLLGSLLALAAYGACGLLVVFFGGSLVDDAPEDGADRPDLPARGNIDPAALLRRRPARHRRRRR